MPLDHKTPEHKTQWRAWLKQALHQGVSVKEFWDMTPFELTLTTEPFSSSLPYNHVGTHPPLYQDELKELMKQWPD
jgi:hypothetical protein